MTKKETIQIRVTADEKAAIKKQAKTQGFDTITSYLLWLSRTAAKSAKSSQK